MMDQILQAFRKAAAAEQRGRRPLQRRYSQALRAQAVEYWRRQQASGVRLDVAATALGVAPWSLQRWIRTAPAPRPRFRDVQVVEAARPTRALTIVVTAEGARVEGLDVETVVQLLARLR
jgi:transposase-like protein